MSERNFDNVLYAVEDGNAWITINRPDKLNALDRATVKDIVAAAELAVSSSQPELS